MMTIELQILAASVALGIVYLMLAAMAATKQRGSAWNSSNREGPTPPLTGTAFRLDQAYHNFMETFPFFAAAVLAVQASQRWSTLTMIAVHLYFWARVAYLPIYAFGIIYVRSLVWLLSLLGIVLLVIALFLPFNAGT